ncbi:MAG: amidohydrolase [Planctomycetaceae bacterium]|jgi:predicted TIM-barrel fold metal-dependent hydrolase|nr:amidohydrolase [Planctomycetaceae bacterium]|tara:strand:+ start:4715 stop:5695 length:981 start_codon:yes stop_codon:yes gene_type:complete
MTFTRRDFLQSTSALTAAAAASTLTPAAEATAKRLPIIDTHQHLWDLDLFQPPWLGGAPEVLARSYVTSDYKKATRAVNLAKAVYMEVDVNPKNQVKEAEHLIALSKDPRHPTVAAVVSGRPGEASFAPYINNYRNNKYIKGIRQVLHVDSAPPGLCLGDQYVKSVQLLGSMGKSFDLCMRPTELAHGATLADKAPETRLIVDHCGNADPKAWLKDSGEEPWHQVDQWKKDIELLASKDNVVCKISGIVARAPKDDWDASMLAPIVNHCLDSFGPDRVIFGGDWPVCRLVASYKQWVDALKEIVADRPFEEQLKLFHDNAERLYDI